VSSEGDVEFDLRSSELGSLGELVTVGREKHFAMLQDRSVETMQEFLDVQRVLFNASKHYVDEEYPDLNRDIQELDRKLQNRPEPSNRNIERLEDVKDRVQNVLDDAGFKINRETEYDPENALVEGLE